MRFGLDTAPDQLGSRETHLILNALNNQRRYFSGLAQRNRDPEAVGRNLVHALELTVLIDKVKQLTTKGETDGES